MAGADVTPQVPHPSFFLHRLPCPTPPCLQRQLKDTVRFCWENKYEIQFSVSRGSEMKILCFLRRRESQIPVLGYLRSVTLKRFLRGRVGTEEGIQPR